MSAEFEISFPPVTLSVGQIWPDGGAPRNPTAEDVAEVMSTYGHVYKVIADWNLIDLIQIARVGAPADTAVSA